VTNNLYLDAYNLIFCFASHLIFFVDAYKEKE